MLVFNEFGIKINAFVWKLKQFKSQSNYCKLLFLQVYQLKLIKKSGSLLHFHHG